MGYEKIMKIYINESDLENDTSNQYFYLYVDTYEQSGYICRIVSIEKESVTNDFERLGWQIWCSQDGDAYLNDMWCLIKEDNYESLIEMGDVFVKKDQFEFFCKTIKYPNKDIRDRGPFKLTIL
jgi:hypothetical protein